MVAAVVRAVLEAINNSMVLVRIAPLVEIGMIVHALIGAAGGVVAREGLECGQKLPEAAVLIQRLFIPHLCLLYDYIIIQANPSGSAAEQQPTKMDSSRDGRSAQIRPSNQ